MSALDEPQEEVADGEVVYAVVPYTGEALVLRELPNEQLARLLDGARDFERAELRQFKQEVQDEILRRMDREASWTVHAENGWKLSGKSPGGVEYDVDALRKVLAELLVEDRITAVAVEKAVKAKPVEYTVQKAGVNALLKLGGHVQQAIEACQVPSSKPRYVSVSREGT